MRAGGVNIEAGTLYLAAVDPDELVLGRPVAINQPKLVPHEYLVGAEALHDLTERVREEISSAQLAAVGLVETRAFKALQYKHVYPRVVGMCAVMAACTALGVRYKTLKTETIGTAVGAPAKALNTVSPEAFLLAKPPKYWTAGLAEAYAAAATMLTREGG
ncbi:hypothetical protein ACRCUN_08545 [Mycobacterium sp. LTG2003]